MVHTMRRIPTGLLIFADLKWKEEMGREVGREKI